MAILRNFARLPRFFMFLFVLGTNREFRTLKIERDDF